MKQIILLSAMIAITNIGLAQLSCKTIKNNDGSTIKTCFHINGKPSTVETWDKINREGRMICYTNLGKEIINYNLRHFAGHSSVYLDYNTNGQIKKAEYSSAPDGGIQFYRMIYNFDEQGNQTGFMDLSQPDGHPHLMPFEPSKPAIVIVKPTPKKQDVIACAIPYSTNFELVNETKHKLKILLKAQPNLYVQLKDIMIVLKPKQTTIAYSLLLAQMFLKQEQAYTPKIFETNRRRATCKIILAQPIENNETKTYTWHIIEI